MVVGAREPADAGPNGFCSFVARSRRLCETMPERERVGVTSVARASHERHLCIHSHRHLSRRTQTTLPASSASTARHLCASETNAERRATSTLVANHVADAPPAHAKGTEKRGRMVKTTRNEWQANGLPRPFPTHTRRRRHRCTPQSCRTGHARRSRPPSSCRCSGCCTTEALHRGSRGPGGEGGKPTRWGDSQAHSPPTNDPTLSITQLEPSVVPGTHRCSTPLGRVRPASLPSCTRRRRPGQGPSSRGTRDPCSPA